MWWKGNKWIKSTIYDKCHTNKINNMEKNWDSWGNSWYLQAIPKN